MIRFSHRERLVTRQARDGESSRLPLEIRDSDMTNIDLEYYARRARQERESADRSDEPGARRIHAELASRYTEMVRETVTLQQAAQQG
jgi:hypothetical protein